MVIIRNQNRAFVQKHKWHGSRILTEFSHVFFGGYHKQTSLSLTFRYIITHSYYIALLCWSYINFNFLTRLIHNLLWRHRMEINFLALELYVVCIGSAIVLHMAII